MDLPKFEEELKQICLSNDLDCGSFPWFIIETVSIQKQKKIVVGFSKRQFYIEGKGEDWGEAELNLRNKMNSFLLDIKNGEL